MVKGNAGTLICIGVTLADWTKQRVFLMWETPERDYSRRRHEVKHYLFRVVAYPH